ncbi:MAG TPA: RHS repeat-associated core domain-containing protein, partial [Acidobacteriaceae bacterium]
AEAMSATPCGNNPPLSSWANYNTANNRITTTSMATSGVTYDTAGNLLLDGPHEYWYDAEGRLCAEQTSGSYAIQYIYDAEGARIGKETLSAAPSRYSTCAAPLTGSYTLTARYLVGQGNEQVTEVNGSQQWVHSNLWIASRLSATYATDGLHYELADPLGTRRILAATNGSVQQSCTSLPFGDGEDCPTTPTEHLYTGKERDSESGNDYFGARYYASTMGRFMSPDKPFADQHPANPQSWNLYSYTRNNPLRFIDSDGQIVKEAPTQTTYYSVSGGSASEALANANQHFSGGFAGNTHYDMNFTYDFSRASSASGNGSVTVTDTVTSDVVNLQQTITLPQWDGYDKASPEEQKAWDSAVKQLDSHEHEHVEINRAGADALDKSLPGTTGTATGKGLDPTTKAADNNLKSAVNDKSTANQQQTNQNNQHLDACTNHGTQSCGK